jgi:hypothetical protein
LWNWAGDLRDPIGRWGGEPGKEHCCPPIRPICPIRPGQDGQAEQGAEPEETEADGDRGVTSIGLGLEGGCGLAWRVVPSPYIGNSSMLSAVAAISSDDVWAVGDLILHWDGGSWVQVPAPAAAGEG